jgi:hypothetical protein
MPKRPRRWSAKPVLAGSSPAATSNFLALATMGIDVGGERYDVLAKVAMSKAGVYKS